MVDIYKLMFRFIICFFGDSLFILGECSQLVAINHRNFIPDLLNINILITLTLLMISFEHSMPKLMN